MSHPTHKDSREAILKTNHAEKVMNWEKVFVQNPLIIESAYEAMSEYAELIAIEFAEWVEDNDYWAKPPLTVTNLDGELVPFRLWYKHGQSVGGIKTEQLFLKSKQQSQ